MSSRRERTPSSAKMLPRTANVGCIEHAWLLVSDPVSQQVRTLLKS
jgi:hypothetical protein